MEERNARETETDVVVSVEAACCRLDASCEVVTLRVLVAAVDRPSEAVTA